MRLNECDGYEAMSSLQTYMACGDHMYFLQALKAL